MKKVAFKVEDGKDSRDYFINAMKVKGINDIEVFLRAEGINYVSFYMDQRRDQVKYVKPILALIYDDVIKSLSKGTYNGKETYILNVYERHDRTICCC